jgi:hypothetical protein
VSTTIKGAQAVVGESGLIAGILCKIAIIKKYTLAILLNCNISDSNIKINITRNKIVPSIFRCFYKICLEI